MTVPDLKQPLLSVRDLCIKTSTGLPILDGVSFDVGAGEIVALVGESGSGKTVAARATMRLLPKVIRPVAGEILFNQRDVLKMTDAEIRAIRGAQIGMVFQEPMVSLNPAMTIGAQLIEGLRLHEKLGIDAALTRATDMLERVRIADPAACLAAFPHQFSGGMRQRIMLASVMLLRPKLLIADEPTTALDVTIQAEILALIDRLKRETGMAVLFITHDMGVVAQMADRVVVMYRGRVVEEGPVGRIFEAPREDYTRMLLAAAPRLGAMRGKPAPGRSASQTPVKPEVLLEVRNLTTRFPVKGGVLQRRVANVHAVEDVSFSLNVGETLTLVGESGCGKSTTGRSILRLTDAHSGHVQLNGWEVLKLAPADLRRA
uniref:ATP-binding cassette domain-containing protein n=1 Tax=uncultured Rhizobium sp. TaxID=155567 RepID=UPI00261341BC